MRLYDAIFPPKEVKRHYAASRRNRQNADWVTRPTSENWELRQSLFTLRARAREASKNDPHLSRYLALTRDNVVGQKGITLQSRALKLDKTLDTELNKHVEEMWWLWGHAETCTASGKLDWKGLQDLVATQVECDGEALVQMVAADNDFGFALKVVNVDYLDEFYNDILPGSRNRVIMSIEIDAFDKPVAYWLTTPASDIQFTQRRERIRTRVPAEEMIHIFVPLADEAQVRGVTAFAPVLLTAKNFTAYKTGVIQSARFTSNIPLFIKQLLADGEQYTGPEDDEGRVTNPVFDVGPLAINLLEPGQEPWQLDPKQPTQNHSAFCKTLLMEMAAGLGVPYFLLANDWEATNFSSSRGGLDAARDMWRKKQQMLSTTLCRRVFHVWARSALMTGQLKVTMKQFAEIQNPAWKGRGWNYIDPSKDINASVTALENKLTTWTDELAEKGIDFTEHLNKIKAEQDQANAMGIDLVAISSVKVADAGTPPSPDEGGTKPADKKTPPKRELLNGHTDVFS